MWFRREGIPIQFSSSSPATLGEAIPSVQLAGSSRRRSENANNVRFDDPMGSDDICIIFASSLEYRCVAVQLGRTRERTPSLRLKSAEFIFHVAMPCGRVVGNGHEQMILECCYAATRRGQQVPESHCDRLSRFQLLESCLLLRFDGFNSWEICLDALQRRTMPIYAAEIS